MKVSLVALICFSAFCAHVFAQDENASKGMLKQYMNLRKLVRKTMQADLMTSVGKIQSWKYRKSCLPDDMAMLPQRLLDWFHVLKSISQKKTGVSNVDSPINRGCTSWAITWFFKEFDANKDLSLDESELNEVESIPYEHCLKKFFAKCDLNEDAKLSIEETCGCFNVEPPCKQDLDKYNDERRKNSIGKRVLGKFKPDCDEDGFYKSRQCQGQYCWCVDRFNQVIEGTRDKSWLVHCRDNTDPSEPLFAGDRALFDV